MGESPSTLTLVLNMTHLLVFLVWISTSCLFVLVPELADANLNLESLVQDKELLRKTRCLGLSRSMKDLCSKLHICSCMHLYIIYPLASQQFPWSTVEFDVSYSHRHLLCFL